MNGKPESTAAGAAGPPKMGGTLMKSWSSHPRYY